MTDFYELTGRIDAVLDRQTYHEWECQYVPALRAVLRLHHPISVPSDMVCDACQGENDERGWKWPCPTVHAIIHELGLTASAPPLDPDPELIDHLEGNRRSLRGYRKAAERMREEANDD